MRLPQQIALIVAFTVTGLALAEAPAITPAALIDSANKSSADKATAVAAEAEKQLAPQGTLPVIPPGIEPTRETAVAVQKVAALPQPAPAPAVPVSPIPLVVLPPPLAPGQLPVAALPPEPSTPAKAAPPLPEPRKAFLADFSGPEVAVILARNQFFPSTIRVRSGSTTRLLFTTVNRRPGALILERLAVQKWIPGEPAPAPLTELERAKSEVDRELTAQKVTEVLIDPKPGNYTFYDALSGASGEIVAE